MIFTVPGDRKSSIRFQLFDRMKDVQGSPLFLCFCLSLRFSVCVCVLMCVWGASMGVLLVVYMVITWMQRGKRYGPFSVTA